MGFPSLLHRSPKIDARYFQLTFLIALLIIGATTRHFEIGWPSTVTILGASFLTQALCIYARWARLDSLLSAGITAISIVLLCRSNSLFLLALVCALSIASKFILRYDGKHFFNPSNFGIVLVSLLTGGTWISPAQWGSDLLLTFWFLGMGLTVVISSRRWDTSFVFLLTYTGLLFLRVLYLEQNLDVFWHQLQSGSLLLFTFFMISDPRSTPNHRTGRILFAIAVAIAAFVLRVHYFLPHAVLFALFFLSPLTVLLDIVWRQKRFEWRSPYESNSLVHSLS